MAIRIPTIGPDGQIGGSVATTQDVQPLTYSGLSLKSQAGEELKKLANVSQKFVTDLNKVQYQIKQDQEEATLLDIQNTFQQDDLRVFASLINPDNPDNALGANATDAKYQQLIQQRKSMMNNAMNGEFTGLFSDYGDKLSNLSRSSGIAFKKFAVNSTVAYETKLLNHFSEQAKAYKTQALETDILSAEQALPTDATAFDANIKNLTLKIAGLLKYQGLYSVENVQTQLHEKFSVHIITCCISCCGPCNRIINSCVTISYLFIRCC